MPPSPSPSHPFYLPPSPSPSHVLQDHTHNSPSPSLSPVSPDSTPESSPSPSPPQQQDPPVSYPPQPATRWPKLKLAPPPKSPKLLPPQTSLLPPTSAPPLPSPPPASPLTWHNPATAANVFPVPRNSPSSNRFPPAAVTGATATCIIVLAAGLGLLWFLRNRARQKQHRGDGDADLSKSGKPRVPAPQTAVLSPATSWIWRYMFDYGELADATDGFAERNLIGEGGFGFVYKGQLRDGKEVAVKRLKQTGSPRAERQFQAEVEIISKVHHRNLVSLLGYCICKEQRLLVYEFVPNGTLEQHLHEEAMPELLNWDRRMKIAVGAARGLAYLHQDCHPQIIHCDVKSSNILLDQNFNPKVSDFGLAILMSDPYGHATTHVVGTLGYLAPDYPLSGKLTDKSDVYSFGVLLMEIVTGKKPIDSARDSDYGSLIEWGQPLLERVLDERDVTIILDPRLEKRNFNKDEVLRVLEVAASCLNPSPKGRPKMTQVVRMLEKEDHSSLHHPHAADDAACDTQDTDQLALAKVFRMMACADHHHLIDHTGACSMDFHTTSYFTKSNATQCSQ